ncbi:DNA methyltransferase [Sphingopyxis terrae subsp. ummariensis]
MKNELYYGDNLDVLRRKIASESVDLCYIDPPFNSKRNYFQIYNNQGSEDRAQAQAFVDTWNWGDEAVEGLDYILDIERLNPRPGDTPWTEQTVELIRGLEKVLGRGSLLAYLVHMTLRIVEIHRVLKPTGSFYLHCDPTASHYLKLVLDAVFCGQGGQFINEIVWCYNVGGKSKKWFARKHDVLFWYGKGAEHFFDGTLAGLERETGTKSFGGKMGVDEDGRRYQDKLVKSSGKYYRYYLDDPKIPEDWWVDINSLQSQDAERMGYPTQKPEALLERIIRTSSAEDSVVLDAYCGCGTSVAVAQRLGRRWIGIDITYQSIALILKRLEDRYPDDWPEIEANILLDGVPRDLESAMALANRKDDKTRKEFEKWAILTFSKNQARINEKKGADGGIDGIAYFLLDKDSNGKAIFQVKSRPGNRGDLATLNSDRLREKAEFGFLICTSLPTKPMRDEIAAAGKFKHPLLNREDDRLQVVTVADLFDHPNKPALRLDLPMARKDAVKSAQAIGDNDKQATLDL